MCPLAHTVRITTQERSTADALSLLTCPHGLAPAMETDFSHSKQFLLPTTWWTLWCCHICPFPKTEVPQMCVTPRQDTKGKSFRVFFSDVHTLWSYYLNAFDLQNEQFCRIQSNITEETTKQIFLTYSFLLAKGFVSGDWTALGFCICSSPALKLF